MPSSNSRRPIHVSNLAKKLLQFLRNTLSEKTLEKWNPLHNRNYIQVSQLVAAVLVGIGAFLFAQGINRAQKLFDLGFEAYPFLTTAVSPFLFLGAVLLVVRFAPEAKGSGIPQVLQAIMESPQQKKSGPGGALVSMKTAFWKIASTLTGILGGASIGREGPTVQIASSLFALVARKANRYFGQVDFRSFLVAGASAGISAAFNTPLAGITFAIEEIAESSFGQFKRVVMLSVIVGGITAQALGGNYHYFGHPLIAEPSSSLYPVTIVIGLAGGLFGGLFCLVLTRPLRNLLPKAWWHKALVCGIACSLLCYISKGNTAGSGYEVTRKFMDDPSGSLPILFFPEKFLTTVLSYLSGMAGGIFSPSLSIGAGMGLDIGHLFQLPDLKACALIGMVAFFSGVVQAPLTAVVILMEMTDQSMLLIPFLVAAFLAHGIGKLLMPVPLYRWLSLRDEKSGQAKNNGY